VPRSMVDAGVQDLAALDRDVARAARGLARWRAALAAGDEEAPDVDPFDGLRRAAAKSTWDRLGELDVSAADEPLRAALRRWVLALVEARILRVDDVALAREEAEARGRYEGPRPRAVSSREAWRGVATAKSPAEVQLWLEAAADAGGPIASARRTRASRRTEIARRMGLEHPWTLAAPLTPSALRASAARVLDRTDDLSRAVWARAIDEAKGTSAAAAVLHSAMAREAGDGWPAHLAPRWFEDVFGAGLRGLPLDLPALPPAAGAASFARALVVLGRTFRVASTSSSMPFAVAYDPLFASAHRVGFVFGALAADPEFQVRALGLGRRGAGAQGRVLARTALLELRAGAARIVLGDGGARDAFDATTARLFGEPLDPRLRGAWPVERDDEPARWLAMLQAPSLRQSLRDRFDVDWFRNPRAWAELRGLGAGPAVDRAEPTDDASLDASADALVRAFEDALG
jgi:hypothetical protein